jgi:hypothetical protein
VCLGLWKLLTPTTAQPSGAQHSLLTRNSLRIRWLLSSCLCHKVWCMHACIRLHMLCTLCSWENTIT